MERIRRIHILMDQGTHYARGVMLGILGPRNRPGRRMFLPAVLGSSELHIAAPEIRKLKPDGIIAHLNDPLVAEGLAQFRVPVVNTGNPFGRWPRVGVDDLAVGRMVAEQFVRQGFRNFAFMHFHGWGFSARRCAGFAAALAESGFACAEFSPPPGPRGIQGRRAVLPLPSESPAGRWVLSLPRPVGVMAASDGMGDLLIRICATQNIRVPEEVAIIGVDNDQIACGLCFPPLSSVELPLESIGARALAMLEDWIDGKRPPSEPVLLPPVKVVQRQSSDILMVDDPEVRAALHFIRQHAHEPFNVGDILRAVPVARRALEQRFARQLGRSLLAEIHRARVQLAKELLASTSLDMPAIAARVGFSMASTFCKVFRARAGMPPTQYRRLFHANPSADEALAGRRRSPRRTVRRRSR